MLHGSAKKLHMPNGVLKQVGTSHRRKHLAPAPLNVIEGVSQ